LFVRADHAVHWFHFISAIEDDSPDAVRFGRELVQFRIKNKRFLPDDYGAIFCGYWTGELRAWRKIGGLDKCMRESAAACSEIVLPVDANSIERFAAKELSEHRLKTSANMDKERRSQVSVGTGGMCAADELR
jgi:hypothetical protein